MLDFDTKHEAEVMRVLMKIENFPLLKKRHLSGIKADHRQGEVSLQHLACLDDAPSSTLRGAGFLRP